MTHVGPCHDIVASSRDGIRVCLFTRMGQWGQHEGFTTNTWILSCATNMLLLLLHGTDLALARSCIASSANPHLYYDVG